MKPHIVIPAAGASSRMRGRDKLVEVVDGQPLLVRQTRMAASSGLSVTVLLAPDSQREHLLGDISGARLLLVPDAAEGMGATLRVASRVVGDAPMVVLLPDVPGVNSEVLHEVLERFDALRGNAVVRASDPDGRPGTPLIIPSRLVPTFSKLKGDDGGKSALHNEVVEVIKYPDDRATRDLDTPEEWATWRAEQLSQS